MWNELVQFDDSVILFYTMALMLFDTVALNNDNKTSVRMSSTYVEIYIQLCLKFLSLV